MREKVFKGILMTSAPDVLSPKDSFDFRKGNSRLGAHLQSGNLRRKFLPSQEIVPVGFGQHICRPQEEVVPHVQIVYQLLGISEAVGEKYPAEKTLWNSLKKYGYTTDKETKRIIPLP